MRDIFKVLEQIKDVLKENEVIKINNEGTIEYINSSYIMYYALD